MGNIPKGHYPEANKESEYSYSYPDRKGFDLRHMVDILSEYGLALLSESIFIILPRASDQILFCQN